MAEELDFLVVFGVVGAESDFEEHWTKVVGN